MNIYLTCKNPAALIEFSKEKDTDAAKFLLQLCNKPDKYLL